MTVHDGDGGTTATAPAPAPAPETAPSSVQQTSVMAILSLVFAFVVPLAGVILGIVALVRLKTGEKRGKGLAIAGIVVGVVTSLLVAALIAASALFTAAVVDAAGTSDASAIVGDITQEVLPDTKITANVGDCAAAFTDGYMTSLPTVDCAQPHANEVYSVTSVTGDAYPGAEAVDNAAVAACAADYEAFVGRRFEESVLQLNYFAPTERSWNSVDDRQVICFLSDPNGETTGTLRGSAR